MKTQKTLFGEPEKTQSTVHETEMPRYKMIEKGVLALSDAEVLSTVMNGNVTDALEASRNLLFYADNDLHELRKMNIQEMQRVPGITPTRAMAILAVFEMGKRVQITEARKKEKISCSKDAFDLMHPVFAGQHREYFKCMFLGRSNKVLKIANISEGGLAGTVADPKVIFKMALDYKACSIILAHNHPSGNHTPSDADIKLTRKMKEAGQMLDIPVIDHVIVTDESYFSFADEGLI